MVSGGSVDGLISGMNTTQIISQLMQSEAAPQIALKNKVAAQNATVTAYQSVNTRAAALQSAAAAMTSDTTWTAVTATSSSDAVVATATSGATTGSLTFNVDQLATGYTIITDNSVSDLSDVISSSANLTFTVDAGQGDGSTKDISFAAGDGSLQAVVNAINANKEVGVKAAAVQVSPGQYKLQLNSTSTGANSTFISAGIDSLGGFNIVTDAQDAQLTVGTGPGAYQITSHSNTFAGVLPGVTVTATKEATAVKVNVASDAAGIAGKVTALVNAANAALDEIAKQSKPDPTGKSSGPLAGDYGMRELASRILETVAGGAGDLGSMKTVGVELTRDGHLTFDQSAFLTKLAADPDATKSYFTRPTTDVDGVTTDRGLAGALKSVADAASHSGTGTLALRISGAKDFITSLNDQISGWDTRLADRQNELQREFTAMEVSLGKLKDQSTWLSGQLASLPSASSSG